MAATMLAPLLLPKLVGAHAVSRSVTLIHNAESDSP